MRGGPAELAHGPIFIGLMFNMFLFGLVVAQCYIYYTTYKRDALWIKIFIVVLFVFDLFNSVMNIIFLYDGLIKHFGDVEYIGTLNWYIIAAEPLSTGVVEVMVQFFYAWRIHVLIRNWFLTISLFTISFTGGIGAIVTGIQSFKVVKWEKLQTTFPELAIWLVCSAVVDIAITVSLVWHLRRHRTGFRKTDMVIDRIIRITMQTGLITSIVAVINIIVFITDPTGSHSILNVPLSKLYSNSLLSSLNSRGGWKSSQVSEPSPADQGNSSAFIATYHGDATSTLQTVGDTTRTGSIVSKMPTSFLKGFSNKPPMVQSRPEVVVHVESHEMQDNMHPERKGSKTAKYLESEGDQSSVEDRPDTGYGANRV